MFACGLKTLKGLTVRKGTFLLGLPQKDEVFLWEEEKQRSDIAICR